MLSDIDALAKDVETFSEELKSIVDQTFVMMKNKNVWFGLTGIMLRYIPNLNVLM